MTSLRTFPRLVFGIATIFAIPALADAADPVAMVEEASPGSGVAAFDYLAPGQAIALGTQERVVIDYLSSCVRETILGGTVTIGTEKSAIEHGKAQREHVACDGGNLALAQNKSNDSAVVVFRRLTRPVAPAESIKIERRIFTRCPVVNLAGAESLTIERLDRPEAPVTIAVAPDRKLHGGFYDFAAGTCPFVANGIYRLGVGSRYLVFAVDPAARHVSGPLASRMLLF